MNSSIRQLLNKENPTPRDIGRLFVAMKVDLYNGKEGLPREQYERLINLVYAKPEYDEYKMYLGASQAIEEARDLGEGVIRQAYLACAGLKMFDEALYFANVKSSKQRWDMYALGKIKPATIKRGTWLWRNLRNTVKASAAIKGALRVAGEWLEVPRLETVLPSDKPLKREVDELDLYAQKTLAILETAKPAGYIPREIQDILMPINFELNQPTKKEMNNVREKFNTFKIGLFYKRLEGVIGELNLYGSEPLPGANE